MDKPGVCGGGACDAVPCRRPVLCSLGVPTTLQHHCATHPMAEQPVPHELHTGLSLENKPLFLVFESARVKWESC